MPPVSNPELRGLTLSQAIRLTPATLAYHLTDGKWVPARHLLYIAQVIAREVRMGDARIIVEAPPRHGKSELLSVHTPTWFLDEFPDKYVMLCSYNQDLPNGFSRRVRDTIATFGGVERGPSRLGQEPDDLPDLRRAVLNVKLRADSRQVSQWNTSVGGGMYAVGLGGALTGRGAHLLLVDDFVKNAEEAESPAVQEHTWEWFTSTAYTRLEPGGSLVCLATRWNTNDLIGKLKVAAKTLGGRWILLTLPALAGEQDLLGRKKGDALWPERYDEKALADRKAVLGSYYFSALFQQAPKRKDEVDSYPERIKELDILPDLNVVQKVRSWDFAGTAGAGDYTVGTKIGCKGNPGTTSAQYYFYNIVRGQWSSKAVEEKLLETAKEDGYDTTIVIEQEPGSAGKAYAEYLKTKVLREYKVIIVKANESKWIKATPMLAAIENYQFSTGRIKDMDTFKAELVEFPDGKHDDCVDSAAIGFNYLVTLQRKSAVWGRPPGSEQGYAVVEKISRGATFGRSNHNGIMIARKR